MRLQSLELSGFKSFARKTILQFPDAVTAIVGPNGAGKSNIAEAVRWVLGEQSMKSLRGKRGEDLIFNGSASSPRMGKASVSLHFDNHDGAIPLDFESVTVSRKIFRDGTNEYALNGSAVRLKDVVELIARMGLGEAKHNIIGQGEVDRFLAVGPRERREFLEEALGLKLPQLKKREAERKLSQTLQNARQVEALLREIRPHLKFLKSQADKAEKGEAVRKELDEYYRTYIALEGTAVAGETSRLTEEALPAAAKLKALEQEIAVRKQEIDAAEPGGGRDELLKAKEEELEALEEKRRALERELGRIEGRLETARGEFRGKERKISVFTLETKLEPILRELRQVLESSDLQALKLRIQTLIKKIESLLSELKGAPAAAESAGLTEERTHRQRELDELNRALAGTKQELEQGIQAIRQSQSRLVERFETLRTYEEEANRLRVSLERLSFEREKLDLRRQELGRMIAESGLADETLKSEGAHHPDAEAPELKKKIEKLRVRLEEIGGIDPAVLKEHQDTKSRHDFLERELTDLTAAAEDLKKLISELERRIEHDLKKGFKKVNEAFHQYFRTIFGGGKGLLAYRPVGREMPARESEEDEAQAGAAEAEYGIDIEVDLPKKRVKSLNMLSGGERALTAISLLFAITAVSPPPFLALDETDAALDEANSAKYAAILKELSKKTQLIMITHNRETMKQAGVLYGVTMGEDGISKLLSLKLEEAESYGNH